MMMLVVKQGQYLHLEKAIDYMFIWGTEIFYILYL